MDNLKTRKKKYIEAGKLFQDIASNSNSPLSEWDTWGVMAVVAQQPAADVEEVRHGSYGDRDEKITFNCRECSECHLFVPVADWCPFCGAKMDLE